MDSKRIIIMNTCPDLETAEGLARSLVETRLAACVNVLPKALSVYRWKGAIESAEEHLLLIKSNTSRYSDVERHIVENHPYELPEIVAVPIVDGLDGYLSWVDKEVEDKS